MPPIATILIEPVVRAALLEDLGRAGDITTDAIVPAGARARTALVARHAGVLAGLEVALLAFRLLDATIETCVQRPDGSHISPGDVIATITGPARGILSAERVALNFLCHLSGVASATAAVVDALRGYQTRVTCTRKTVPGLRALQKYAVRVGGGSNHRFGLDDAILIKDNHVAVAGGIVPAIERARASAGHLVRIEVEVDSLTQLADALKARADAVLLDNMDLDILRRAVGMVAGRAVTEASGRITPGTAASVAACGVDLISIGWLTHSASALDIALDYLD
ncbi:MAG TPA: carboxylating nicotinate-nucleotide diphosphorylase [Candidatus Binataceae bacterium]|nr:carboxylating nicotinate-nucleotide diphosphorylase [Candidatus Binataceae bacterium]